MTELGYTVAGEKVEELRKIESSALEREKKAQDALEQLNAFKRKVEGALQSLIDDLDEAQSPQKRAPSVPPSQRVIDQGLEACLKAAHSRLRVAESFCQQLQKSFKAWEEFSLWVEQRRAAREKAQELSPPAEEGAQTPEDIVPLEERRTHERIPLYTQVSFEDDTNFYVGFSSDISEGGIFIATYDTLDIGTAVQLKLDIDGHGPLEVQGVVRWIRPETRAMMPGMGVQFDPMAVDSKATIDKVVKRHEPLFYDLN